MSAKEPSGGRLPTQNKVTRHRSPEDLRPQTLQDEPQAFALSRPWSGSPEMDGNPWPIRRLSVRHRAGAGNSAFLGSGAPRNGKRPHQSMPRINQAATSPITSSSLVSFRMPLNESRPPLLETMRFSTQSTTIKSYSQRSAAEGDRSLQSPDWIHCCSLPRRLQSSIDISNVTRIPLLPVPQTPRSLSVSGPHSIEPAIWV